MSAREIDAAGRQRGACGAMPQRMGLRAGAERCGGPEVLPLSMGSRQELVLSPAAEKRLCASTGKVTFLCVCYMFAFLDYFFKSLCCKRSVLVGQKALKQRGCNFSWGGELMQHSCVHSAAAQCFAPDGAVLLGCTGEGRAAWAEQGWSFTAVEALRETELCWNLGSSTS